jgi:hypothetical protein
VAAVISFNGAGSIAFESFGVRVRVTADTPEVIQRIPSILPPGATPCPAATVDESWALLADDGRSYRFERDGSPAADLLDLELALTLFENQLRTYVGLRAPDRIFVRAGVVAHEDRAIVIPAPSLAGKTTLVGELVRAGAIYYSDEFAVLDRRGLVHPFPTTPSLREPGRPSDDDVPHLNGGPGEEPLTIGTVVLTTYRPGAQWRPTRLSPGRGVTAMLAHTPAARARPEEAIRSISEALGGAVILEGERGEAQELVTQLLSAVSTPPRDD